MVLKNDNVYSKCHSCGEDYWIAYWDWELEYYIYLTDESKHCLKCCSTLEDKGLLKEKQVSPNV